MKHYYPDGDLSDWLNIYGYTSAQALVHVLQQCGDKLTRENVMREAANIHDLTLPMLLPGIRVNTSPTDFYPIRQTVLRRFDGKAWVQAGRRRSRTTRVRRHPAAQREVGTLQAVARRTLARWRRSAATEAPTNARGTDMNGKIGLEEHFAISDTLADARGFVGEAIWGDLRERLLDFQDKRLAEMDRYGMEKMIVSLHAPGVQRVDDKRKAIEVARRANDMLAQQIAKRPDRFEGFAALAMQDPDEAAKELQRCVKDYGFKGAMVNGYSQLGNPENCLYYDLREYWDFWGVVERSTCRSISIRASRVSGVPTKAIPG